MAFPLDHGGPLVIGDPPAHPERPPLLLDTWVCGNTDCSRVHVEIRQLEHAPPGGARASDASSTIPPVCMEVDVKTGLVRPDDEARRLPDAPAVRSRFEFLLAENDGHLLELLRRRWRHAAGTWRDGWQHIDWSDWEPGDLMPWREVFPDGPSLFFRTGDDLTFLDDLHCIAEDCHCHRVVLVVDRVEGLTAHPETSLSVDLEDGTLRDGRTRGAPTAAQRRLWASTQERLPSLLTTLRARRDKVRGVASELRAFAPQRLPRSQRPNPAPPRAARVGRNAPCPCGSGRKHKKCCLQAS